MRDFKQEARGLFDRPAIDKLCGILRIADPSAQQDFAFEMIDLCAHYREIISTLPCDLHKAGAPFNLSLTKRADWLETQVIKPAQRLMDALQAENRPMFSTWPYPLDPPKFRDNDRLNAELTELLAETNKLRQDLRNQQADDAGHSQELRQEVFNALARLFRKHAPDVKPNRGTYDEHPDPKKRKRIGNYVDAMRLAFGTVVGRDESLDRLIRSEIHYPS